MASWTKDEVEQAARGQWDRVYAHVAPGKYDDALRIARTRTSGHATCPLGTHEDRNPSFRFNDLDNGHAVCSCGSYDCWELLKHGTKLYANSDFPELISRVAAAVGLQPSTNGNGKPKPVSPDELFTRFCTAKGMIYQGRPVVEELKKYGARANSDGTDFIVPQVSTDVADGKADVTSWSYDQQGKGKNARGKKTGLYAPSYKPEPGDKVTLHEGFKDAATALAMGYRAYGTPGKFLKREFSEWFRGVHVTIVPDLDSPGMQGVDRTASCLYGIAASVKVARLPGPIKESGGADLRDILKEENGEQLVRDAIDNAQPWEPPPLPSDDELSLLSPIGMTELGNGRRLARKLSGRLHHVISWKAPIMYDGVVWQREGAEIELTAEMKKIVEYDLSMELGRLLSNPNLEKDRREFLLEQGQRFIKASSKKNAIQAAIFLAQSEDRVPISHETLDSDQWLLNTPSATIDLRTGKARNNDPADLITQVTAVSWDPEATCPTWERVVGEVFAQNESLIEFFQRAVGYSLTGMTSERCFFFAYGGGRNGKTTVISTVQKLLGSYAAQITTELLMMQRNQVHPTEVCDLHAKRLAVASETEEGRRMAESLVKALTGGEDAMKGRRMHQDFWSFRPTHKLWLSGNHKPQITGTDDAIWDRVKLIPFNVRFDQPDKSLPQKLEAELPGILNWAIEGCLKWQRDGLGEPEEVRAAVSEYRHEQDWFSAFIAERCEPSKGGVQASELFAALTDYCETHDIDMEKNRINKTSFGRKLTHAGYPAEKAAGVVYRCGIDLKPQQDVEIVL